MYLFLRKEHLLSFLMIYSLLGFDKIFNCWFLGVSHSILWKNENAVNRLQIPALVPEIFKFEKWVKYANEMTDDVIHVTQCDMKYINRAILANLQRRSLKLGRLIVHQKTHLRLYNILFPWQVTLFQSPPAWFEGTNSS